MISGNRQRGANNQAQQIGVVETVRSSSAHHRSISNKTQQDIESAVGRTPHDHTAVQVPSTSASSSRHIEDAHDLERHGARGHTVPSTAACSQLITSTSTAQQLRRGLRYLPQWVLVTAWRALFRTIMKPTYTSIKSLLGCCVPEMLQADVRIVSVPTHATLEASFTDELATKFKTTKPSHGGSVLYVVLYQVEERINAKRVLEDVHSALEGHREPKQPGEVILVFVHQHLPGSSSIPLEAQNMTDDASYTSLMYSFDKCLDMFCWHGDFSHHKDLNRLAFEQLSDAARAASPKHGAGGGHSNSLMQPLTQ